METWKIVLICYCAICYFFAILSFVFEYKERKKHGTHKQIGLRMYLAYLFVPFFSSLYCPMLFLVII